MKRRESYPLKQSANPATQESTPNSQALVIDVLTHAAALARRGDLLQAEDLMKTLPDRDSSRIEVLDLLARICAQQGKIDQAQALWTKALQGDPSNMRFLSALKLCACLKKPRFEQFALRYLWVLLVVILWFLIATAIIVSTAL